MSFHWSLWVLIPSDVSICGCVATNSSKHLSRNSFARLDSVAAGSEAAGVAVWLKAVTTPTRSAKIREADFCIRQCRYGRDDDHRFLPLYSGVACSAPNPVF